MSERAMRVEQTCAECGRVFCAGEGAEPTCGLCALRRTRRTLRERAVKSREVIASMRPPLPEASAQEVEAIRRRTEPPTDRGGRVADTVARVGGTWAFVGGFLVAIAVCMAVNASAGAFDPYPFILLNLVLSCVAAIQAPIILMSQNRASERDRAQATEDFRVNVQADHAVAVVQAKLDVLLESRWDELDLEGSEGRILEDVLDRLDALEEKR